jgi:hypothetical protein
MLHNIKKYGIIALLSVLGAAALGWGLFLFGLVVFVFGTFFLFAVGVAAFLFFFAMVIQALTSDRPQKRL